MFETFIKYVIGEWAVIRGAPVIFTAAILVVAIALFLLMSWGYGREVSFLNAQLGDYRERLKGATPAQAAKQIEWLQQVVENTVGYPWRSLSLPEVRALSEEAKKIPHRKIQVMYLNYQGKELAQSVADAFTEAGWEVNFSMGGGFENGTFVGRSKSISEQLKLAIEKTTKLTPALIGKPDEEHGPNGFVFFAVGVNTTKPAL